MRPSLIAGSVTPWCVEVAIIDFLRAAADLYGLTSVPTA
jgi:hypothetical protein